MHMWTSYIHRGLPCLFRLEPIPIAYLEILGLAGNYGLQCCLFAAILVDDSTPPKMDSILPVSHLRLLTS